MRRRSRAAGRLASPTPSPQPRRSPRAPLGSRGLRRRGESRDQAAVHAWMAHVEPGDTGPVEPEPGFELELATRDEIERIDGSGVLVRFTTLTHRFGGGDWERSGDDADRPPLLPNPAEFAAELADRDSGRGLGRLPAGGRRRSTAAPGAQEDAREAERSQLGVARAGAARAAAHLRAAARVAAPLGRGAPAGSPGLPRGREPRRAIHAASTANQASSSRGRASRRGRRASGRASGRGRGAGARRPPPRPGPATACARPRSARRPAARATVTKVPTSTPRKAIAGEHEVHPPGAGRSSSRRGRRGRTRAGPRPIAQTASSASPAAIARPRGRAASASAPTTARLSRQRRTKFASITQP